MNLSPLLTKSIALILQESLPRMNVRSNFLIIFLPMFMVSQVRQSAPLAQPTTSSFLESLLEDAQEILPILLRQSCIQVLNFTQDKRSSARDIGDIIKRDQTMLANIVKIALSPAPIDHVFH